MELGKVPPHDIEAEQAVIGSMLTDKDAVMLAVEKLKSDSFYREDNKAIFEAMLNLYNKSEPIDLITVKDELDAMNLFDKVGGMEYLALLPAKVPTTANAQKYISIVEEKYMLRNLIKTANEIIDLGYSPTEDADDVINLAQKKIFDLVQNNGNTGFSPIKDVLIDSISKLEEGDWSSVASILGKLSEAQIYIDDTPGISVMEIRTRCRKLKMEKDIGLIIIDYLQLVQGSNNRKNGSREQEIAEISRSLKILAKELNVPVIALSQLSRAVEQREDHRPMLSDLRESGSIEQDADIVMFLYRDDYYNKDSEDKGLTEVIIAKHRGGSTGTVKLVWMGNYTKFTNLARGYEE